MGFNSAFKGLTTSMPGPRDLLPAEVEPPNCPQGLRLSRSPRELVLLVWPG